MNKLSIIIPGYNEEGNIQECLRQISAMELEAEIVVVDDGDIIVILDADYTIPPSEIPAAIKLIIEGKADFVNGTRFTYPMESNAMKRLHVFSNKAAAGIISAYLGQTDYRFLMRFEEVPGWTPST